MGTAARIVTRQHMARAVVRTVAQHSTGQALQQDASTSCLWQLRPQAAATVAAASCHEHKVGSAMSVLHYVHPTYACKQVPAVGV
jgi:hypothetical protein